MSGFEGMVPGWERSVREEKDGLLCEGLLRGEAGASAGKDTGAPWENCREKVTMCYIWLVRWWTSILEI